MAEDSKPSIELGCFQALLGESFTLQLDGHDWSAVLSEVESIPNHRPEAEREPFSLSFKVDAPDLPQASYQVSHPSLPAQPIFLVPVAGDRSCTTLQAIFN